MKLYTPEEVMVQLLQITGEVVPEVVAKEMQGRQYVCMPKDFIQHRLEPGWALGLSFAHHFRSYPNFVVNPDVGLEKITKRFAIYDATDIEFHDETMRTWFVTKTDLRMEFDTIQEYCDLQKVKSTKESRVGYVLFDTRQLHLGGYGLMAVRDVLGLIAKLLDQA